MTDFVITVIQIFIGDVGDSDVEVAIVNASSLVGFSTVHSGLLAGTAPDVVRAEDGQSVSDPIVIARVRLIQTALEYRLASSLRQEKARHDVAEVLLWNSSRCSVIREIS